MKSMHLATALVSGLLLGLTTIGNNPPYLIHWAIFFGFVPVWASWQGKTSALAIFFSGWICQFVFTLIAFHWLAYTVNEFSHMGMAPSLVVLLLYCSIANLQFPIAGLAWHRYFRNSNIPHSVQITALALLTALFQRLGTTIFHWNFGYAWLYMQWPGYHLADIAGFRWLCSLSICLNGFLLLAWLRRKEGGWWKPLLIGSGIFLLVNTLGWLNFKRLTEPDAIAKVLLIQPNIGNRDKQKLEHGEKQFRQVILDKYLAQTQKALQSNPVQPDFAVWPENAFPSIIADRELNTGLEPVLKTFLVKNKLNLLTGSMGLDEGSNKITNSLFSLSSEGRWSSPPYHKIYLLPFGEYVPLATQFPTLKEWLPDVRDYGWGTKPKLLNSGNILIGPQICFEGLFDSVSRDLAKLGAQIIVNITNDSWYGDWMEPWQHFYISMAKAVETRRPLVRGTNTGLSGVMLASGELLEISPIAKEWFGFYDVPYRKQPPTTIFMSWGFWIDWVFLLGGLLTCLAIRKRKLEAPARF